MLSESGYKLSIYIGESDKFQSLPLFEWIIKKARENGLAGATAFRGLEGFGAHSRIHTTKNLRLTSDMPVLIEIIDTEEKINNFLPLIDTAISEGLVTVEKVNIKLYRSRKK